MTTSMIYMGRTVDIVVGEPTGNVPSRPFYYAVIDGQRFGLGYGVEGEAALKAARAIIDDEAIRPACVALVGTLTDDEAASLPRPSRDDLFVGRPVAFYSRGAYRVGLVTKVGRTNVSVAYTTRGSVDEVARGRISRAGITRKSVPFAGVGAM